MDAVVRAIVTYLFLWVILRIAGKRTLSEATTFDFVLLLTISEAVQQALIGKDSSVTNAVVVVSTLVGIDILVSVLKRNYRRVDRILEGQPLLLINNGVVVEEAMRRSRVEEGEILEAARRLRGLEGLDEIRYAVLEPSGGITIIPKK